MRFASILLTLLSIVGVYGCAAATSVPLEEVRPGDAVRATLSGDSLPQVERVISRRTPDSLVMRLATDEVSAAVAIHDLSGLQVRRTPSRAAGAVMGGMVGLIGGLILGFAFGGGGDSTDGQAIAPAAGAVVGLPVGAILGAILASDRWVEVPLP